MSAKRTAGHLASFGRFLARREQRERADTAALEDLAKTPLPLPRGLSIEWLGTAGYRITHEGHTLLIDPYLSRVPLSATFKRAPALADPALQQRLLAPELGSVEGVLVGHTHFDHALDVPSLTRALGTRAYGSDSLLRLMHLYDLGDSAVEAVPHHP